MWLCSAIKYDAYSPMFHICLNIIMAMPESTVTVAGEDR